MTLLSPTVEIFLNGVWTDITARVRVDPGITISRGRADEQSTPTAAQCTLSLDNRDGRFTPRNSGSTYYPYLIKNTPLRVSCGGGIRFTGYVSEWPQGWEPSEHVIWTQITANGIRRRLQQSNTTERASYSPSLLGTSGNRLKAYWPMQDGSTSTSFASALATANPAGFAGVPVLASSDPFAGSAPLPLFGDSTSFTGAVPSYFWPPATGAQVRMLIKCAGTAAGSGFRIRLDTNGAHYFLYSFAADTSKATLVMVNYQTGATEYTYGSSFTMAEVTTGCRLSFEVKQNGTGIDLNVVTLVPGSSSGASYGVQTIPLATLGKIVQTTMFTFGTSNSLTLGHVSVEDQISSIFDLGLALNGFDGETALSRCTRIAAEQGWAVVEPAGPVTSCQLGPQPDATPLAIFDEAMTVDGGISSEDVTTTALYARKLSALYSQTAAPALAFTDLLELQPVDDDQTTENDITVTRTNGSSTRVVSTDPVMAPSNIGTYDKSYALNLHADGQTADQAGLRLALGTINLPRTPVVSVDAARLTGTKLSDIKAMREGQVISVSGAPAFVGVTNPVRLMVTGWTETMTAVEWIFTMSAVPADPYDVLILDSATFGILNQDRLGL